MIQSSPKLQCFILDTGYCTFWENYLIRGGAHKQVACHSLVALLHHPTHGWILWDTGYAQRMLDVTQQLPFSLYRRATPLHLDPKLSVVAQLGRWHLSAGDIQHVIISHFHADHIAGLRDFPQAELIASQTAYADVAERRGLRALKRAFIPELLPKDFTQRARLISNFTDQTLPALGATHDLFGDQSLLLVPLPGHAHGQVGMLAQTERGPILFAADGCWLRKSIEERRPPSRLTGIFIDDARSVSRTINNLSDFSQAHKDIVIIPSHCPEVYAQEIEGQHETI